MRRTAFLIFVVSVIFLSFAIAGLVKQSLTETDLETFIIDRPLSNENDTEISVSLPQTDTLNLLVASNWYSRYLGLSNYNFVSACDGMIFLYPSPRNVSLIMRDMNFNLDFAFVDATGTVTKIVRNVARDFDGVIESAEPVVAVIEMPTENEKAGLLKVGATMKSSLDAFSKH